MLHLPRESSRDFLETTNPPAEARGCVALREGV
jgi:hypothetical protein